MSTHQLWNHRTRTRKSLNRGTKGLGACRPRRLGMEVLEQRRLLSIGAGVEPFVGPLPAPPGWAETVELAAEATTPDTVITGRIEPLRVAVWTEEPIADLGAWVESQSWPDCFPFGVSREEVEQLIVMPLRSDPRGGYRTVLRIDAPLYADPQQAADEVAELPFVDYAKIDRLCVLKYTERTQELVDNITIGQGSMVFHASEGSSVTSSVKSGPTQMRVSWWSEEKITDVASFVEAQTWPSALGPVDRDNVELLISRPFLCKPDRGYLNVARIDVFGDIAALDQVPFLEHARLEGESVIRYTSPSEESANAITTTGDPTEIDLALPPWLFIELPNGRNLCGIVNSNLARLHYEYEAFLAAGGEAADFVPDDPSLPLWHDRVSVTILCRDFVKREEVDQYGDVVETINWDFIHDLEAAGLEVGALGPYTLGALLPFDAVDDVAMVPDVAGVRAVKPELLDDAGSGAGVQRGPDLQLPPWLLLQFSDGRSLSGQVSSNLAQLHYQYQSFIDSGGRKAEFVPNVPGLRIRGGRIPVRIVTLERVKWEEVDQYGDTAEIINWAFIEKLEAAGLEITALSERSLGAFLPFDAIDDVAVLDGVGTIRAMTPVTWVGDTTTQGDEAQRSDEVRSSSGLDGSGVSVGVLSDSYDQDEGALTDAADDVASGDLPNQVTVLEDWDDAAATDEGRAMLQIVHDVAPQANLLFHSAVITPDDFAEGIRDLAIAGADIIVDDALWPDEPMFVDGLVAQAVNEVVDDGVVYVSAAGNYANHSYESAFDDSGVTFFSTTKYEGTAHDFDLSGATDYYQEFTLAPGATIKLSFQWDEPVGSLMSEGSSSDLDIWVLNEACNDVLASGAEDNVGEDPIEWLEYTNSSGVTQTYNLVITHRSGTGEAPGLMKYVDFRSANFTEYATDSPTLFGHANADGAIAVGAAAFYDTPEFGTSPPARRDFTARGGVQILFDTEGNRLQEPENREKPEVVGPDYVNNTFFGQDLVGEGDTDTFPNFQGTSAAAPHVAGLAALMLQAAPAATPAGICKALESTAVDMADDDWTGHGLVDAVAAIDEIMDRFPNFDADDDPAGENADDGQPDTFEISRVGDYLQVKINGTALDLIHIDDVGGISITGSGDDDTVTVYALGTDFDDGDDYANVAVLGQTGDDEAHLYDSTGDDYYWANCGSAHLWTETAYRIEADGFESTYGYATAGGTDLVKLFDTNYDDVFDADPTQAVLYHTGLYHSQVEGFDLVHAYHTTGNDEANLTGSSTIDDTFYSTWQEPNKHASLSGAGYYVRAKEFTDVYASGGGGGADVAEFHDSAGDDLFCTWNGNCGNMAVGGITGFAHQASGFPTITAYADGGGADIAKLFDTSGNDSFVLTDMGTAAELYRAGVYSNKVYDFDAVHAYGSNGGYDKAFLYDTNGDDIFDANPTQGALYRSGVFYVRAKTFEEVHAYASGGTDTAYLAGSSGDDSFASNRFSMIQGELWGTGFFNRAKNFDQVYADLGQGGADNVELRDSSGDDFLEAGGAWAAISNEDAGWRYDIGGLLGLNDLVTPYSSEGDDTDDIMYPITYTLDLTYWNP